MPDQNDNAEVTAGEMKPNGIFALGVLLLRLIRATCSDLKDPKTKLPYFGVPSLSTSASVPSYVPLKSHCFYYRCDYHSVFSLVNQCLEYDEKCITTSQVVQTLKNLLLFSLPVLKSCSKVVVGAQTLVYFTYSDLCEMTDNFSKESLFAVTQFGEAYRGRIQQGWKDMGEQDIIVKLWEQLHYSKFVRQIRKSSLEDNICRLRDEVFLLTQSWMVDNPNVVKLLGYCFEDKKVAAVYSVKPIYTLESLFDDEWFKWKDRIVAAQELARTIALLHGKEYVLCNFSGAHIMIDQDKKPILYDFSMLHGQVLSHGQRAARSMHHFPTIDYIDPYLVESGSAVPLTDIYTFGVLLMSLICKRDMYPVIRDFIYKHVEDEFKSKSSFVHESFVSHPNFDRGDAHKLLALAMDCRELEYLIRRPTANEIVKQLQSLSFSDTLFSTDVKAKVVDARAKIERKPSLWRKLRLFKKMSIARDEHEKQIFQSSQELAKQKDVSEGPRFFRPVIFAETPEEMLYRRQLVNESLKQEREKFERRMSRKKNMAKLSQSNFVKQLGFV
ncbi:hypothetical protein KSS87_016024 [Heliosperma pusillum]|nr:hypothetical protein KSS87_016024 [Heliosperma pusillum]